jgi:glutamyl/glutaminyl-tRNA synthetase
LHIGGGRTALFNWLFSQSQKGKFILRIEDTDRERSKKEFVDEILYSLKWLGFNWDELYYQSQRFERYRMHADKLLKSGQAYIEKSPEGKEAIIYKVNPKKIKVKDLIRGEIEFDSALIKDQVLIKSDGTPTYNFACVVDDAEMNITHIIRGDDHISNTPKQIMLYEALGFGLPNFAHLPLIMGVDGGRLSKRTGATAISDYRKMGYLAEALLNYLLLLSWAPGDNRELISVKEAIGLFDIKNVNKTSATFDLKKLDWINSQWIKKLSIEELYQKSLPFFEEKEFYKSWNMKPASSAGRESYYRTEKKELGLIRLPELRLEVESRKYKVLSEKEKMLNTSYLIPATILVDMKKERWTNLPHRQARN